MPQLMPLMWVTSVCMVSFIVLVLINIYNYYVEYNLDNILLCEGIEKFNLVW